MDPLSVATSCVTLVATITRCSHSVTIFVREVRDARSDLDMISRELHSLKTVLVLLSDDFAKPSSKTLPPRLVEHLGSILRNCNGVVVEVERSLAKHGSSRLGRGGHWALGGGKDDMAKFRSNLEAHKTALELALELITMTITRDIKRDTTDIRRHTVVVPDIKKDTTRILEEITQLRARLPTDFIHGGPNIILQRFLDESSSYAETVVNDSEPSEPFELAGLTPERPAIKLHESENIYDKFAFYPPERHHESTQTIAHQTQSYSASSSRSSPPPLSSQTSRRNLTANINDTTRTPSRLNPSVEKELTESRISLPANLKNSGLSLPPRPPGSHHYRKAPGNILDASRNPSQLSLGINNDFKQSQLSLVSSHGFPPPSRPSSSHRYRETSGTSIAAVRPTSLAEFQDRLRRPDDWKWLTLHHKTKSGNSLLSASEQWIHRYTAMTRAPSYLIQLDFRLRQKLDPPRETMLLIGIHYPETFAEDEFNARVATTIGSVTEALSATPSFCGTPASGILWWTTVVVCIMHGQMTTHAPDVLGSDGMQIRCDRESEHCGMAPDDVRDEDKKIYAHVWEHTTSRTKIIWNRRGMPEYFEEGDTPLQLIECQYTSRAGRLKDMGGEEHLAPFIRMLDARSCVSVAAGDKISKYDLFDAYMTTRHHLSSITVFNPMQQYQDARFESLYVHQYSGVPTKVYPQENVEKFKQEKPSFYKKFWSFFG
ncbi:hypothetical protein GQ44DRAFT_757349 [Phaeosphaeriaceae sp. PMI808]|nr:hypothetical protein GQ44DRAFT_757349 [Phaeosphaeriaceae sp. PMI808]